MQSGEDPAYRNQLIVGPDFDEFTLVYDTDKICAFHGGQPMCDHDHRTPFRQCITRCKCERV